MFAGLGFRFWSTLVAAAWVMTMSSGAAASCPAGYKVDMPSCASVTLTNNDQNYDVRNDCPFSMMIAIRVNTGVEVATYLNPGANDFASLPAGMTVDAIQCCTFEEPDYKCSHAASTSTGG